MGVVRHQGAFSVEKGYPWSKWSLNDGARMTTGRVPRVRGRAWRRLAGRRQAGQGRQTTGRSSVDRSPLDYSWRERGTSKGEGADTDLGASTSTVRDTGGHADAVLSQVH